ncbi:hypothetical protein B0H11DRAFT_1690090, partial [Mycena galericulata]
RSSPVHFFHVKAHAGNHHNEQADAAAKRGAELDLPAEGYVSCRAPLPPPNSGILPAIDVPKVTCDIPESSSQVPPTQEKIPSTPLSHRGRALFRAMQRANLKRLTDASSNSAAFWKVYRSMADPKRRAPAVSLSDLASCFEKRMNAPEPPPPEFNLDFKHVVEERAESIPYPSVDLNSEDQTFNNPVSEGDMEWAKNHLESH